WAAVPEITGQIIDKASIFVHSTLVKRVRSQVAVDVPGLQVSHHLRRGHNADLNILVRMDTALSQEISEKVIVHGEIERHAEPESLHISGRLYALVFDVQGDGLAVDILHRRHVKGGR